MRSVTSRDYELAVTRQGTVEFEDSQPYVPQDVFANSSVIGYLNDAEFDEDGYAFAAEAGATVNQSPSAREL